MDANSNAQNIMLATRALNNLPLYLQGRTLKNFAVGKMALAVEAKQFAMADQWKAIFEAAKRLENMG